VKVLFVSEADFLVVDFAVGPAGLEPANQTVMSDGISISFVEFTVVLLDFDRVRCVSIKSFLVRNWCSAAGG
jgi:hypothetical protein